MIVKHWKLSLLKNGRQVVLFSTTTDRMIEQDGAEEIANSLICTARQYHRRPQTSEQDHRDLAIGAFMRYALSPMYDLTYEQIEVAAGVPTGAPNRYVGGVRDAFVPIWETHPSDAE